MHLSTKTFGHEVGLSCCFRQWRADSHCNKLHGYALSVKLTFSAECLDERNWVVDFGGLRGVKELLQNMFDHKLVVAQDDPELDYICSLAGMGIADVVVLPGVGCEVFAWVVFNRVHKWLDEHPRHRDHRVRLEEVEISEHGANSAIYRR